MDYQPPIDPNLPADAQHIDDDYPEEPKEAVDSEEDQDYKPEDNGEERLKDNENDNG